MRGAPTASTICRTTKNVAKARSLFFRRSAIPSSPHARVDDDVEGVDDEVHQNETRRDDQDRGLDQRVIALRDRAQDETPQARNGEDLLDHDGAAEQIARHDADTGDERNERVAKGV